MKIINQTLEWKEVFAHAGGKAGSLARLAQTGAKVPPFIAIGKDLLQKYLEDNQLLELVESDMAPAEMEKKIEEAFKKNDLSEEIKNQISAALEKEGLLGQQLAVRSSGLDEDSVDHSFAGQFSSYLFQESLDDIFYSLRMCWASAYSERGLTYRMTNELNRKNIQMGVVIQKMVRSKVSGVMFTRNPIDVTDRKQMVIESLWGQGEGLVSGLYQADNYLVARHGEEITETLSEKDKMLIQNPEQAGIIEIEVAKDLIEVSSSTPEQLMELRDMGMAIEKEYQMPMDIEWASDHTGTMIVQARPITNMPHPAYYQDHMIGSEPILWDNSNIIESFSGMTTPLTFSATRLAYATVYRNTCQMVGVPQEWIVNFDNEFNNMLGNVRGRVYYNLLNWYKILFLIPGTSSSKGFMETMLGVKEELTEEQQKMFEFVDSVPKYSGLKTAQLLFNMISKFRNLDQTVIEFFENFNRHYTKYKATDFENCSLPELYFMYKNWDKNITNKWDAPIINDFMVMIFFGTLKKLTEKYIPDAGANLHNDLLCGQGDLESTMPTKTLMIIAGKVDANYPNEKDIIMNNPAKEVYALLSGDVKDMIDDYLDKYGFRCSDEQKIEEKDLTDDPTFAMGVLASYLRNQNYSVEEMEKKEKEIRNKAEEIINQNLSGVRKLIYTWVLKHARKVVSNRENLRFARSKSFGISRRLFRAIGNKLVAFGELESIDQFYYLSINEVEDYMTGAGTTYSLLPIAKARMEEYENYRSMPEPPDRFLSYGAAAYTLKSSNLTAAGDLLKGKLKISDDPDLLYGISCCPGEIEGIARVAENIDDAEGLAGEILVTYRTDPGWVPLYPSCSGLIIERGSLLSHSAVVARELGLPTIVGVNGGLLEKIKTGDRILLNATNGEIRILERAQGEA